MLNLTAMLVEIAVPATVAAALGIRFGRRAACPLAGFVYGSAWFMATEAVLRVTVVVFTRTTHVYGPQPGSVVFNIGPFAYDFRLYSLLLLGAVLFTRARRAMGAARALTYARPHATAAGRRLMAAILAVSAPLVPFVPHAWWLSGLSLINLAALTLAHHRLPSAVPAPAGHRSAHAA